MLSNTSGQSALTISGTASSDSRVLPDMAPPVQISAARPESSAGEPDPGRAVDPLVPVMRRDALGYPEHQEGRGDYDMAAYAPLSVALSRRFPWDAHFCAYSLPSVPRRLAKDPALELGPMMVLFVVDVDAPKEHRLPDDSASPAWREGEDPKIKRLLEDYPAAYIYTTRGGYRIIYRIEPITLRNVDGKRRWSEIYLDAVECLREDFDIVADERCVDWTRLYRLPHVVRDGTPTDAAILSDPATIGLWEWEWDTTDLPVDEVTTHTPRAANAKALLPADDKIAEAVRVLGEAWPSTGRHVAHLALSGALARAGWGVDAIAEFCAAVAKVQQPGNEDHDKRLTAARSSVDKITSGADVTGWPTLRQHVAPEVVREACRLLGIEVLDPPDPEFFNEMLARYMPTPTASEIRAHLVAVARSRSTRPETIKAAELIKRVLKLGEIATNDVELAQAALAVVRAVPDGTTPAQISEALRRFAGQLASDLDGVVSRALKCRNAPPPEGEFVIDEHTGKPRASQQNLDIALDKLGVVLSYDQLGEHEIIERNCQRDRIEDKHINRLYFEIESSFGFRADDGYLNRYLSDRAHANEYHPVRDYLAGVEPTWDGVPRIDTWLINLAGAKDTPFVRAVSRLVLVAACRRVRHPGEKFDELLVLESTQGTAKSSALATLCPEPAWFGDDMPLGADTQRRMEAIEGKWIIECGELKGMRAADHLDLKAFLSRTTDECRMAYARRKAIRPRQCVFVGTTNDREYLKDQTGNRRYWPVEIRRFDLVKLREQRDQLWAEAAHAETAGKSIRLADELWPDAAIEQEQRRPMSLIEERLRIAFDGVSEGKIKADDVRALAGFGLREPNTAESSQINAVMSSLGWTRPQSALRWGANQKRAYGYTRGTGEQILVKHLDAVVPAAGVTPPGVEPKSV